MLKRNKDILRSIVGNLRDTLIGTYNSNGEWVRGDLDRELERIGVAPDGTILPIDVLITPTAFDRQAHAVAEAQLLSVPQKERIDVRRELVERAAYSWSNRLLALRAMEARDLIDETLRANPDYQGIPEALYVLRQSEPGRVAGGDGGWWAVLEDACRVQASALPGLFNLSDLTVALRPSTTALLKCVTAIGSAPSGYTTEETDAAFADPDAIGWAYQFYQEEPKKQAYAKLNAGGKIGTRAEIAAATQLFTEPYMVKWLLENSLGRSYHELFPDSKLPQTWEYYTEPETFEEPTYTGLVSLTILDPCVGSGHFLRVAFDMLVEMYHEQHKDLNATQIADLILGQHLHGIDIDPRAAQLAAFTLYLRAREFVRGEHKTQRKTSVAIYKPPAMNIAATPTGLNEGSLERHLRRYPQDTVLKPLLHGIFQAFEQADILGSLLRPAEYLDKAILALQAPQTMRTEFDVDADTLRRTITELARQDPTELKRILLDRVAKSFADEDGNTNDVTRMLFGYEAEQGIRLLQLLDQRYAVVVTNPPYMGTANMNSNLRAYLERRYRVGKSDLYSAFMLRCLGLCRFNGRVAMITMQNWMFLKSFLDLRAAPEELLVESYRNRDMTGLLRETSFEKLAHLGPNAFEEISGEVVQSVMFVLCNHQPSSDHSMHAFRLVGYKNSLEKQRLLKLASRSNITGLSFFVRQSVFLSIPESPIIYWLPSKLNSILRSQPPLGRGSQPWFSVKDGMNTGDNERFVRFHWEVVGDRWCKYSKGGGYRKWSGLEYYVLDWGNSGERIVSAALTGTRFQNTNTFFKSALCYSLMAQGALGVRFTENTAYDGAGLSIQPVRSADRDLIAATLNCRLVSYLARLLAQDIKFRGGYIERVPQPLHMPITGAECVPLILDLKSHELSTDMLEMRFVPTLHTSVDSTIAMRHALEGIIERIVFDSYGIDAESVQLITSEVGVPVGWFPLIVGYDAMPNTMIANQLPTAATTLWGKQQHIELDMHQLTLIKSQLRQLYQRDNTGKEPIRRNPDDGDDPSASENLSAHVPIPPETFLEELSQKLCIHPISVYWLLEELRADGVRCKPEEQRLLEDRLSVIVLRVLGHRWPKEIGGPLSGWADQDGIIPLTSGTGETNLSDRIRTRLQDEEGILGAQQTQALLAELTNFTLEDWLCKKFFLRHIHQFKSRPIAWHLASTPQTGGSNGKGSRRSPAFECLVYYHACAGDVLARIISQYVQPIYLNEQRRAQEALQAKDEVGAAIAQDRAAELSDFIQRLRQVAAEGFACPALDKFLVAEPLDRWSGDGYMAPASIDELIGNERAWHVDLNNGVRVNIAPLQLAGLLAEDVLKAADAKKALQDRAHWRADERCCVREGKLPRCGWMGEEVPESARWRELAPKRAEEQAKLEKKRKAGLSGRTERDSLPLFDM